MKLTASFGRALPKAAASICLLGLVMVGCRHPGGESSVNRAESGERFEQERHALARSLAAEGIHDAAVLEAVKSVPRHVFVPRDLEASAYEDRPLPIGAGQTISQPFVVAYMTEALRLQPGNKVLEVGTGSGYQAAILAEVGAAVFSIEIVPELSAQAREALDAAGYGAVRLRVGDGYAGWQEEAPFDRVIVTAAAREIPAPLIEQLAPQGVLVMPVEEDASAAQWIVVLEKASDGSVSSRRTLPVRFVPLTGEALRRR